MPAGNARVDTSERATDLQSYIADGRIAEAMDEFYAPEVVMQENTDAPCVGLAANKLREAEFVASVKQWKRYEVMTLAVEGDTSLVESVSDFVLKDGTVVHLEQVSRAKWRGGKIIHERFYHA